MFKFKADQDPEVTKKKKKKKKSTTRVRDRGPIPDIKKINDLKIKFYWLKAFLIWMSSK